MHWEKEIRIRITIRRLVIAVLAASTAANLVIVGVVFGEDSPTTTPTAQFLSTVTSLPTAAISVPTSLPEGPALSTVTQIPGVIPSDTLTPTPTSTDAPLWIVCIKRFYWPTYPVQPGDTLFSLASAVGSTVRELLSANCLTSDRINAGQLLHLPRLPVGITLTLSATSTATQTTTATATASQTSTSTATASATMTNSPTATVTPSQTLTNTSTATPTGTNTEPPSATPTATSTNPSIYTPTPTPTNTPRIIVTVGSTGGPTLVPAAQ
jgi:LysM repeat protein